MSRLPAVVSTGLAAAFVAAALGGCGDDTNRHPGEDAGTEVTDGGPRIDGGVPADDGGAPGADGPIRQVAAGRHHTCALMRDGSMYCWGQGAYRALGGDYNFQGTPRLVEAIGNATSVAAGTRFGCAIRPAADVWCWGENANGQIGANATMPCGDCTPIPACADSVCVGTPQPVAGLDSGVAEVALGGAHGCARRDDGSVLCWGDDSLGQVGNGAVGGDVPAPEVVAGIDDARGITAGTGHSCALVGSPGHVLCWGDNERAQVGNGESGAPVPVPARVAGVDDVVEVVAGGSHTCARRAGGSVVCWGYNYLGALGNGSTRPTRASTIQEVVGITDAVEIAAGQHFTCARRASGALACWGHNQHGQLGDGTSNGADCAGRDCKTSPVEVGVVRDAVLVEAGELHACAANAEGRMWCWGYNLGGQLGTGGVDRGPTPTPIEVAGLP